MGKEKKISLPEVLRNVFQKVYFLVLGGGGLEGVLNFHTSFFLNTSLNEHIVLGTICARNVFQKSCFYSGESGSPLMTRLSLNKHEEYLKRKRPKS